MALRLKESEAPRAFSRKNYIYIMFKSAALLRRAFFTAENGKIYKKSGRGGKIFAQISVSVCQFDFKVL